MKHVVGIGWIMDAAADEAAQPFNTLVPVYPGSRFHRQSPPHRQPQLPEFVCPQHATVSEGSQQLIRSAGEQHVAPRALFFVAFPAKNRTKFSERSSSTPAT
ncbi:MAG TPA: hypothetical protein VKZ50_07960 [bacterium]|nr:hypothetical protein [bacterium]